MLVKVRLRIRGYFERLGIRCSGLRLLDYRWMLAKIEDLAVMKDWELGVYYHNTGIGGLGMDACN